MYVFLVLQLPHQQMEQLATLVQKVCIVQTELLKLTVE